MNSKHKTGSLVKIKKDPWADTVVGWYSYDNIFKLKIFKEKIVYGIFLNDNPHMSNHVIYYKVFIYNKIYYFCFDQIEFLKT